MVDQEPHRSVQIIRRIDTRVPTPLLSTSVGTSSVAPASLGRLTPLRAPVAQQPAAGPSRHATPAASSQAPGTRGWTAIVANPSSSRVSPAPSPTAWLTGGNSTQRPTGSSTPARVRTPNVTTTTTTAVAASVPEGDVPDDWEDDV